MAGPGRFDLRAYGRAAFLSALLAGASGILLAVPYDPADPHASVEAMAGAWAWLRGFHSWSATFAVAFAFLHLAQAWVRNRRAARRPREWGLRVAGFALLLAAVMVGGFLPWDQQAYESLRHASLASEPFGFDAGGWTPRTHFLLHAIAVPGALAGVAMLWLGRDRFARARTLPARLRAALLLAGAAIGGAALLALFAPPELGPRPIEGVAASRPDWPFLWLVPLQEWWGGQAGLLAGLALAAALAAAAPFLGRSWRTQTRLAVAGLVAATILILGFLGAR